MTAPQNEYAARHGLNGFVVSSPGLSLPRPDELHSRARCSPTMRHADGMPPTNSHCWRGRLKNASALQVALALVLRQDFPVVALVGPSSIDNLKSALGALDVELTSDELRYLDLSH